MTEYDCSLSVLNDNLLEIIEKLDKLIEVLSQKSEVKE